MSSLSVNIPGFLLGRRSCLRSIVVSIETTEQFWVWHFHYVFYFVI